MWQWTELSEVERLLRPAAELRDELARTGAVARRRLPRLREFSHDWGRTLMPGNGRGVRSLLPARLPGTPLPGRPPLKPAT